MTQPIICRPRYAEVRLIRATCECSTRRRRWMVARFSLWYSYYMTCLRCGEQYGDGEQLERPFRRGWRRENIRAAERLYRQHGPRTMTEEDFC